jgi:hypothetical protein
MGADGARLNSMGPMGRVFFTIFPFALLPITMNFPWQVPVAIFSLSNIKTRGAVEIDGSARISLQNHFFHENILLMGIIQ